MRSINGFDFFDLPSADGDDSPNDEVGLVGVVGIDGTLRAMEDVT